MTPSMTRWRRSERWLDFAEVCPIETQKSKIPILSRNRDKGVVRICLGYSNLQAGSFSSRPAVLRNEENQKEVDDRSGKDAAADRAGDSVDPPRKSVYIRGSSENGRIPWRGPDGGGGLASWLRFALAARVGSRRRDKINWGFRD